MAQNISLDKSSQSTFAKAVKNIKILLKRKKEEVKNESQSKSCVPTTKTIMGKSRTNKRARKYLDRGVVYISHIPKGFYEDQMKPYFSQFGRVTRLNVVRSKITGRPKGYAFIEFLHLEVAQVVAETMNNYLMFGRVLKAKYIPGDQVRPGMFSFSKIRPENCPRSRAQKKWIQRKNKLLTDTEITEMAAHELKQFNKIKKQMKESRIKYKCQVSY